MPVTCDSSHEGLGAWSLQKNDKNERELGMYASRYLIDYETRNSTNELKILAIVWDDKNFRNFVYRVRFEAISDYKVLEILLKSNHGNTTLLTKIMVTKYSSRFARWIERLLHFDMEVVHQSEQNMGSADSLSRDPNNYNKNERSKSAKKLWESWFVVSSVEEVNKYYQRQLPTNQRLKKLYNQPMRIHEKESVKEKVESADLLECGSKQTKMNRLQISRERIATHNLTKASKNSKHEQIVRPNEGKLKTSPLQSMVSSVQKSSLAAEINPEIILTDRNQDKNLQRNHWWIDNGRLSSGLGLQNVRDADLRRDITHLSKESKVYWHVFRVFKYFWVDRELVYYENRTVIPIDLKQAILNSIHSGHGGRDAMVRTVDVVWWPQINRQIVAVVKTCANCQKAGKNVKNLERQKDFGTRLEWAIRKSNQNKSTRNSH